MVPPSDRSERPALKEVIHQLREAMDAPKCWRCGCLHGALSGLNKAASGGSAPELSELRQVLQETREKLVPPEYDCLGCPVCYPAIAINRFAEAFPDLATSLDPCPTDLPEERSGWPPLPGQYQVVRYTAPVAVCTLTSDGLGESFLQAVPPAVGIVGSLFTENLGIERIIRNTVTNPHIRFLILCGEDSRQAVGHLPGQSFLSLARQGIDGRGRIVGAKGKRPILKNVSPAEVTAFRKQVEVIDLIGCVDVNLICDEVGRCAERNPGPAPGHLSLQPVPRTRAHSPGPLKLDPAGYFVIYPVAKTSMIAVEHYRNDGTLNHVLEGVAPADLYVTAIKLGLVTQLDHAAYLGKELERAWLSLRYGMTFLQDAAPDEFGVPAAGEKASRCSC